MDLHGMNNWDIATHQLPFIIWLCRVQAKLLPKERTPTPLNTIFKHTLPIEWWEDSDGALEHPAFTFKGKKLWCWFFNPGLIKAIRKHRYIMNYLNMFSSSEVEDLKKSWPGEVQEILKQVYSILSAGTLIASWETDHSIRLVNTQVS